MPRQKFDLSLIPQAPNLHFEQALWRAGLTAVGGIDEAGRGALAGPVAAGVVILPDRRDIQKSLAGVRDSKQLNASQRSHWASIIHQEATDCQVGFASPGEIDELGIVPATRLAVMRALAQLSIPPQHLLIDFISVPGTGVEQTALIKGDQRSLSIACASILAKVQRDNFMIQMEEQYPDYGFGHHKGYGTAAHLAVLQARGACPIHRLSFAPLRSEE